MAEEQTSNTIRNTSASDETLGNISVGAFMRELSKVLKGTNDDVGDNEDGSLDFSAKKKIIPVNIVGISDKALALIRGEGDKSDGTTVAPSEASNPLVASLIKSLAPIALGIGFLVASVGKIAEGGAMQGANKQGARLGVRAFGLDTKLTKGLGWLGKKLGLEKVAQNLSMAGVRKLNSLSGNKKMISILTNIIGRGGKMAKFVKGLPIIGTLIGVYSGIQRMKNGQVMQGMIDFASAVATMFPGYGTAISVGLDVLNTTMDISNKKTGKTGFGGLMEVIPEWYEKNKYTLPVLGSLTYMGEAFGALDNGDFLGFIDAISMVGMDIPGISFMRDLVMGSKDEEGNIIEGSGQGNLKAGIAKFREFVTVRLKNIIGGVVKSATNQLYENLPDSIVNNALDFLNLSQYKNQAGRDEALAESAKEYANATSSDGLLGFGSKTKQENKSEIYDHMMDQGYSGEEISIAVNKEWTENAKATKAAEAATKENTASNIDMAKSLVLLNKTLYEQNQKDNLSQLINSVNTNSNTTHNYGVGVGTVLKIRQPATN
jgi:hypothetical protein